MERFESLLYVAHPLAGSSRGFSCALDVARSHGARLTLAGVVPSPPADRRGSAVLTPGAAQRHEAHVGRCRARLDRLAATGDAAGVTVRVRVLSGPPAEAVLGEVARNRYDLLAKVPQAYGPAWPWRLHPTDRRLLRASPCPVWMLAPAQGPGIRVVLAGVDVGPGSTQELNARIVRLAASVARPGSELHLVHAWSIVGEPILASAMTGLSRPRMRSVVARTRRERRRRLERLLDRVMPDRRAELAMPKGDAVRALRHEARCREADVVVVGNTGRTGLEALLLGNLPERLVGRVPASVLAVPPAPTGVEDARSVAVSSRPVRAMADFTGEPA